MSTLDEKVMDMRLNSVFRASPLFAKSCLSILVVGAASLVTVTSCETPVVAIGTAQASLPIGAPAPTDAKAASTPDSVFFFAFRLTVDSATGGQSRLTPLQRQAAAGRAKMPFGRPAMGNEPRLAWAVLSTNGSDTVETAAVQHPLHFTAETFEETGAIESHTINLPTSEYFIRVTMLTGGRLAVWEEGVGRNDGRHALGLFKF